MSMTKKEREEMEAIRSALALSKALSWPAYAPTPIDAATASADGTLVVAWWFNSHTREVSQGCFRGHAHSRWRIDKTDSQTTGGPWYRTEIEALQALRVVLTTQYATALAQIDRRIAGEPA